ncbi:MAG: glycoside hydrolase family 127 protein [Anaerolineales bacterium]|nr:glycoside hydrolase family 127 protein [Anaerolineales bacterium]
MTAQANFGPVDNQKSKESLLRTVPYTAVQFTNGFWGNYQELNRTVSLRHGFDMLEQAGNLKNLRLAAGLDTGRFAGYWFADSDVYKWLEAVAWELGRAPDVELAKMGDQAIALVEQAQEENGYLNSYYQTVKPTEKWTDLDHGHELYCAGHLMQAAVAYKRALDDDRLLNVTLKFLDHIDEELVKSGREETCGHPEIETALVELYRVTGTARHLELAQIFIDRRGHNKMRGHAGYGAVYQQDHIPVREAAEMAGHAVRQLYLTTGVTDLYMESGEEALIEAMDRLWDDMTQRKLYVTGGVGPRFDGEAFGSPYELPSDTAYCETCAAIASLMWNWRLLLLTGERKYADLFERTLFNGLLSSPGLEGKSYLYVNPLHVRNGRYVRASADTGTGEARLRPTWHNCACCPPNVMRLFSSLHHYLATVTEAGVQIHQYAAAHLNLTVQDAPVQIAMATAYPQNGQINLTMTQSAASPWSLSLRIPAWCKNYELSLNGEKIAAQQFEGGYVTVERVWEAGDILSLNLPMAPEFIAPHPRIDALRGCVSLQRGPLVYCFESHDQP